MVDELLEVRNLKTNFHTREGLVRAVDDVSFHMRPEETLGLVGESGCGKSVTALSILRLIQSPGSIDGGSILFEGTDLLGLSEGQMREIRGNTISMIFQEPMTSLNPVVPVGKQIAEAVRIHQGVSQREAGARAVEMLRAVRIPSAEVRSREYPHQMSGGMRQRIMIAMAFSCNPKLLIADEPTTSLDVTIQAQILHLMREMKEKRRSSIVLITHDLGLVAENAQRVVVMYAGEIVEIGDVESLFSKPLHPYTVGLLDSVPRRGRRERKSRLTTIEGRVPSLMRLPPGCRFRNRCARCRSGSCPQEKPQLRQLAQGRWVRCWEHE